jgi:hypothetical protein
MQLSVSSLLLLLAVSARSVLSVAVPEPFEANDLEARQATQKLVFCHFMVSSSYIYFLPTART